MGAHLPKKMWKRHDVHLRWQCFPSFLITCGNSNSSYSSFQNFVITCPTWVYLILFEFMTRLCSSDTINSSFLCVIICDWHLFHVIKLVLLVFFIIDEVQMRSSLSGVILTSFPLKTVSCCMNPVFHPVFVSPPVSHCTDVLAPSFRLSPRPGGVFADLSDPWAHLFFFFLERGR